MYGIYINLGCRFEFRMQKLPYERIPAIFPISSILVIRSRYAKKDHFSILAVFQNIWDLHKFGLQIWIQKAKITLWKNFGQFFWFHRFWSSGPGMQKKIISQYYLQLKIYGTYINLDCRFEFRTQRITPWKNFEQFFFFHQFWSSCEKR